MADIVGEIIDKNLIRTDLTSSDDPVARYIWGLFDTLKIKETTLKVSEREVNDSFILGLSLLGDNWTRLVTVPNGVDSYTSATINYSWVDIPVSKNTTWYTLAWTGSNVSWKIKKASDGTTLATTTTTSPYDMSNLGYEGNVYLVASNSGASTPSTVVVTYKPSRLGDRRGTATVLLVQNSNNIFVEPIENANYIDTVLTTATVNYTTHIISGTGSTSHTHGLTLSSSATKTTFQGVKIYTEPNYGGIPYYLLTKVTKHASCTATKCYVYDDANNLLATSTFVGDDAAFSLELDYLRYYKIVAGAEGSSYTARYAGTLPVGDSKIGWATGINDDTWHEDTNAYNIVSLELGDSHTFYSDYIYKGNTTITKAFISVGSSTGVTYAYMYTGSMVWTLIDYNTLTDILVGTYLKYKIVLVGDATIGPDIRIYYE